MVMENLAMTLAELISEYGILAVMLGMVLEEIVVPIPSPVIPMMAGATELIIPAETLPAAVFQIFFYIALPASIASVVSSYFVYGIAYYGGKPAIVNYGKYIDVRWENVQHLEKHFDSGREKYYVALFRAIPIVPLSLVSGSAGLFRMNWKQYGVWSFIGMMPRNFFLALLGWWAKDRVMMLASRIDTLSTWVLLLVVGMVVGWLLYRNISDMQDFIFEKV